MFFLCEMFCEIVFDFSDCKHPKTAEDFLKSTPSKVCSLGFFEAFLDTLVLFGCSENGGK